MNCVTEMRIDALKINQSGGSNLALKNIPLSVLVHLIISICKSRHGISGGGMI